MSSKTEVGGEEGQLMVSAALPAQAALGTGVLSLQGPPAVSAGLRVGRHRQKVQVSHRQNPQGAGRLGLTWEPRNEGREADSRGEGVRPDCWAPRWGLCSH